MRNVPGVIAELGPGDSLGIGLSALLSGCGAYYAFDVVRFIRNDQNLKMLEELLELFKAKTPIPDEVEFPHLFPRLDGYAFPLDILDDAQMRQALSPDRVNKIRVALANPGQELNDSLISYFVPWADRANIRDNSIDLILSQAVLEHVDDLPDAYLNMSRWLKPGGYISHEIDFKSHGITSEWDGYRSYGDYMWRIVRGNRVYLINREPYSTHLRCAREAGFDVGFTQIQKLVPYVRRERLATRFVRLDDDDLSTASTYIMAQNLKIQVSAKLP
ncbi:MAG: methyltransferase domain-containing protein [Elusimicrobiota bacterium]|nr:methyltransferase domain-containing protein [Elusimicrobiota bacterium]